MCRKSDHPLFQEILEYYFCTLSEEHMLTDEALEIIHVGINGLVQLGKVYLARAIVRLVFGDCDERDIINQARKINRKFNYFAPF